MDYPLIWSFLIATAVMLYVLLDGSDLGIGILTAFAKSDEERNLMTATIEPVWDGNETWLILGGGGLFAALPYIKVERDPGLQGGRGRLHVLKLAELVDHPGTVRGRKDLRYRADQVPDGHRSSDRNGGGEGSGAAEASVAVSRRNHFGPLIAVHEPSVSGTPDNNGRRVPPGVPTVGGGQFVSE